MCFGRSEAYDEPKAFKPVGYRRVTANLGNMYYINRSLNKTFSIAAMPHKKMH